MRSDKHPQVLGATSPSVPSLRGGDRGCLASGKTIASQAQRLAAENGERRPGERLHTRDQVGEERTISRTDATIAPTAAPTRSGSGHLCACEGGRKPGLARRHSPPTCSPAATCCCYWSSAFCRWSTPCTSFTKSGQFAGLDNYVKAVGDFRFLPAAQHVAAFLGDLGRDPDRARHPAGAHRPRRASQVAFHYHALPVSSPAYCGAGQRHALALSIRWSARCPSS